MNLVNHAISAVKNLLSRVFNLNILQKNSQGFFVNNSFQTNYASTAIPRASSYPTNFKLVPPPPAPPAPVSFEQTKIKKSNKNCVILVPCNGGIEFKTDESLRILESRGYEVWRVPGYSAIDQGRNRISYDAIYRRKFEEIFWIDSDIFFDPDDVDRIRSYDLPIVGAAYPFKGYPIMTFSPLDCKPIIFDKSSGLVEVKALATGFLFTKAYVFDKIKEKFNLPVCNTSFDSPQIPFFQPAIWNLIEQDYYLGEDFSFCIRASNCGYKIYLDAGVKLGHIGRYTYDWEDVINGVGKLPKPNQNTALTYTDSKLLSKSFGQIG